MVNGAAEVQSAFCNVLSLDHVHCVRAVPSPVRIDDLALSNTLDFVAKGCLGARTSVTSLSIIAFCSL